MIIPGRFRGRLGTATLSKNVIALTIFVIGIGGMHQGVGKCKFEGQ